MKKVFIIRSLILGFFIFFSAISLNCRKQYNEAAANVVPDFFQSDTTISYPAPVSWTHSEFQMFSYSIGYNLKNTTDLINLFQPIKDAGIDYFGPYYGVTQPDENSPSVLAALQVGLQYAYLLPVIGQDGQNQVSFVNNNLPVSSADVQLQVTAMVNSVLSNQVLNKVVGIWYISPEELRPWKQNELQYLSDVRSAIIAAEKSKGISHKPIFSYQPNNRDSLALQNFTKTGAVDSRYDIVSRGAYTYGYNDISATSIIQTGAWSVYGGSQNGRNYSPLIGFNVDRDPTDPLTSDKQIRLLFRNRFYLSIAYGVKGASIWSWATRTNPDGSKLTRPWRDRFWNIWIGLFRELNKTTPNLASAIISGQTGRKDAIKCINLQGSSTSPVLQDFYLDGVHYVIVVNTAVTSLNNLKLSGIPNTHASLIELLNDKNTLPITPDYYFNLDVAQVRIFAISYKP